MNHKLERQDKIRIFLLVAFGVWIAVIMSFCSSCVHRLPENGTQCKIGYGRQCSYLNEDSANGKKYLYPSTIFVCDEDKALQQELLKKGTACRW